MDRVVVLDGAASCRRDRRPRSMRPATEGAAEATGEVNVIPVTLRGARSNR